MKLSHALFFSLTLGATALGCGDDDDTKQQSSPKVFKSGVEEKNAQGESVALKDLDPAQQEAACKALETYASTLVSDAEAKTLGCTFAGTVFAVLAEPKTDQEARTACEMIKAECIKAPAEPEPMVDEPMIEPGECVFTEQTMCTATIAEVEACYTDFLNEQKKALQSLSCSTLTLAELPDDPFGEEPDTEEPDDLPLPASCKVVETKCPGFFDESDEETQTQPPLSPGM